MKLPESYTAKMKTLLGEEFESYLESFEKTEVRGLRVNTWKVCTAEFERISPFPCTRIPWTDNGYYLPSEAKASRHPYYGAGLYYLQEPSAMAPAALLPVEEQDRVLDLCAAPGGKATALAARLGRSGLLVANDVSNSRAKALVKNLELFGASNILVTCESSERLCKYFAGYFDKILVDAPCSGEGMFRREPSMVKDWETHGPGYYEKLQREIISAAALLLRPGGLLLYSTCTFSPQENEGTVLSLLRGPGGFTMLPLPMHTSMEELGIAPGRPDMLKEELTAEETRMLRLAARFYPHRIQGEGHFVALLKKAEAPARPTRSSAKPPVNAKLPKEWEDFAGLLRISLERKRIRLYDNRLYLLPEALAKHSIQGLRFLRTGLYLGEVKQKRFVPSQALAMFLRREEFANVLDFPSADERVLRYLKGETVELETGQSRGWVLVCVDGFPLGWGKEQNGTLKNKLYPGWRWLA